MKSPHIEGAIDTITEDAVRKSSARKVPPGSVLCVMRSGILAHTFPVAVNSVEVTINQDLRALVVRDGVDPDYLAHFLRFSGENILHTCSKHGTTVSSIEASRLERIQVPLPSLAIQRSIVARIDELLAELDDGEVILARARSELETYRKALLKSAVAGELTADWRAANPPKETGADLLQRIFAKRRRQWEQKPGNRGKPYKATAGPNLTTSSELPSSWAWGTYEQCCETLSDGGLKLKERDYLPEGRFPVIDQGAKLVAGYTNDDGLVQPVDSPWILFGDHSRRFKYIERPFCIGADGIKLIRPDPHLSAPYIWQFFQGAHFEDRGYSRHFQFVRALNVPVPPLDEQEEIARSLTELLAEAEGLEELAAQVEQAGSALLRQSILAAAFRGDLVQ